MSENNLNEGLRVRIATFGFCIFRWPRRMYMSTFTYSLQMVCTTLQVHSQWRTVWWHRVYKLWQHKGIEHVHGTATTGSMIHTHSCMWIILLRSQVCTYVSACAQPYTRDCYHNACDTYSACHFSAPPGLRPWARGCQAQSAPRNQLMVKFKRDRGWLKSHSNMRYASLVRREMW